MIDFWSNVDGVDRYCYDPIDIGEDQVIENILEIKTNKANHRLLIFVLNTGEWLGDESLETVTEFRII
ncbi:hypothetical protein A2U01_0010637 [Trifolium medium]|uniref:Uncharacterized protein n=1 Tax=Trifolium medium TaxID=97028 RepID=A0A392MQB5_9FABA|nr:hypothetical protein [Trifolium medium]